MRRAYLLVHNNLNYSQIRHYPRWVNRKPLKVIYPEGINLGKNEEVANNEAIGKNEKVANNETNLKQNTAPKIKWKHPTPIEESKQQSDVLNFKIKPSIKPLIVRKNDKTSVTTDMLEAVVDNEGNLIYTKMKNHDDRIRSIMLDVKSKKVKEKKEVILLEGKRLIKEALEAKCKLEYLVFSRVNEIEYLKPYLPKFGAKLYKMPYKEMQMWSDLTTNPGIMGIFKIPDVGTYTAKNSVPLTVICDNVREPNNLGAILRICSGVGCEKVLLTKGCVNLWDTKVLRSSAGAHFNLQLHKNQTWDMLKNLIPPGAAIFLADNNTSTADSKKIDVEKDINENVAASIPVVPYFSVDIKSNTQPVVLIIGGETQGLSEESFKITKDLNGVRLNIPLSNNMDSLNTGAALAVIAFEWKRKFLNANK